MDAEHYEKIMAEIKLLGKIAKAEQRIADGEQYMDLVELKAKFGI